MPMVDSTRMVEWSWRSLMLVPSLEFVAGSHRPERSAASPPTPLAATRCTVTDNRITVNRGSEFQEVLSLLTMRRNLVTFVQGSLGGVATGRGRTVELVCESLDAEKARDEAPDTFVGPDRV
jgi:hypothetical protein